MTQKLLAENTFMIDNLNYSMYFAYSISNSVQTTKKVGNCQDSLKGIFFLQKKEVKKRLLFIWSNFTLTIYSDKKFEKIVVLV